MTAATNVSVERIISATPEVLYSLVSDVTRMGEWSPESTGGVWRRGATGPVVGARFTGKNRNGFRVWSTTCTVTSADSPHRFAFDVRFGPIPVASWSYTFEPHAAGSRVIEEWQDRRSKFFSVTSGFVMGVPNRAAHNREQMEATLSALAAKAATHSA